MNLLTLLPLLFFTIGNAILGLIIIINNPKSWTNRLFSWLILILTIYLVLNTYVNQLISHEIVLFLSRAIISMGALINLSAFLFLITFPQHQITLRKRYVYVSILLTIFLFFAGFTNLIFADVSIVNGAVVPVPGLLIPIFLLHTIFFVFGGIVEIFLHYRKAEGLEKRKIQFVLLSFLILFSLIIIFNFIVTIFLKFGNFVPFLPIYLLVFNAMVTYSIIRHRLLDIRFFVVRSIGYIATILFAGSVYGLGLFAIEKLVLNTLVSPETIIASILYMLIVTFSFQIFSRGIEKLTERIFYHHTYDQQKLLEELTHIMASTLRLNDISNLVLNKLNQNIQISRTTVALFVENKVDFFLSVGEKHDRTLAEDNIVFELAQYIFQQKTEKVLIFQELSEADHVIKEQMSIYGYQVILILVVENKLLGALFLGGKSSGTVFSSQDIEVLKIFAPEFAVAAKNALSYEEISRFNITLKKEVEEATSELTTANIRLQELDKLKDQFVSLASHELRTPLSAIKSYLWMALAGKGGEVTEKQRYYLERSSTATDRLIKLVNDMLNISRIEAGRIALEIDKVDLAKLCTEVIEEVKARSDELGLHVVFEKPMMSTPQSFEVIADQDKIREVLLNLVGNSLKFTPKGGTIAVSLESKEGRVITHVTDTGSGMTPENMTHLFQKFDLMADSYQAQVNPDFSQGTGLGLYISKSIVTLHHGDIWAESPGKGKGTAFSFSLLPFTPENLEMLKKESTQIADKADIIPSTI